MSRGAPLHWYQSLVNNGFGYDSVDLDRYIDHLHNQSTALFNQHLCPINKTRLVSIKSNYTDRYNRSSQSIVHRNSSQPINHLSRSTMASNRLTPLGNGPPLSLAWLNRRRAPTPEIPVGFEALAHLNRTSAPTLPPGLEHLATVVHQPAPPNSPINDYGVIATVPRHIPTEPAAMRTPHRPPHIHQQETSAPPRRVVPNILPAELNDQPRTPARIRPGTILTPRTEPIPGLPPPPPSPVNTGPRAIFFPRRAPRSAPRLNPPPPAPAPAPPSLPPSPVAVAVAVAPTRPRPRIVTITKPQATAASIRANEEAKARRHANGRCINANVVSYTSAGIATITRTELIDYPKSQQEADYAALLASSTAEE